MRDLNFKIAVDNYTRQVKLPGPPKSAPLMYQKLHMRKTLTHLKQRIYPPYAYKTLPVAGGEGIGDIGVFVDGSGSMQSTWLGVGLGLGTGLSKVVYLVSSSLNNIFVSRLTKSGPIVRGGGNADGSLSLIRNKLGLNTVLYITDGRACGSMWVNGVEIGFFPAGIHYVVIIGKSSINIPFHIHATPDSKYILPTTYITAETPPSDLIKYRTWEMPGLHLIAEGRHYQPDIKKVYMDQYAAYAPKAMWPDKLIPKGQWGIGEPSSPCSAGCATGWFGVICATDGCEGKLGPAWKELI